MYFSKNCLFKEFFVVLLVFLFCSIPTNANSFYLVNFDTKTVVPDSNSFSHYDAVSLPQIDHINYLDPVHIVLDRQDEVEALQACAYRYTAYWVLQYIPDRRDCDDIALIYKAIWAYLGFGNLVGIVYDFTDEHAYNCFWYDKFKNKHPKLMKLEPQDGVVSPFPKRQIYNGDKGHYVAIFW